MHDALGRGIAIFERDVLGENLDLGDRFGRAVAHRAEARNAPPVDEDDRPPAAPAARARLRLERVEQLLDRRGAIARARRLIEFGLGPDVGGGLARKARRRDAALVLALDWQSTRLKTSH